MSGWASFPRASAPPLAPPADATFLVGAGGVRLFTRVEGEGARGVVWFVLGPEAGAAPPYPRLSAALHEARFATAVLHPRGAGYSDGPRGDLDDYALRLGDLRQFLDTLGGRRPLFLLGHSAGAALALEVAAGARGLAGVALVNPAYKLSRAKGMGPSLPDYARFAVTTSSAPPRSPST